MTKVTNDTATCPRGFIWCDGHDSTQDDDWHFHRAVVRTSTGPFTVLLIVDEQSPDADPKVHFTVDEWDIAFGDLADEMREFHELGDAIAAKLAWFTTGIEALKLFTYRRDEEPGEPTLHIWERGRAGSSYKHGLIYDEEKGWRFDPCQPSVDTVPLSDFLTWLDEVNDLRIAHEFLREFVEAER